MAKRIPSDAPDASATAAGPGRGRRPGRPSDTDPRDVHFEEPRRAETMRTDPARIEQAGNSPEQLTSESSGGGPSEDDIRTRAYHRYLERGGTHGMDVDDWVEAERELQQRR